MQILESSDRRLRWENLAETVAEQSGPYFKMEDRILGPGYFIEESISSLQMKSIRIESVSFLSYVFEGGHWIDVHFECAELTHVVFRHCYFQTVDFSGASLRHVRFEHCVFSDCRMPVEDGLHAQIACFTRELPRVEVAPISAPAVEEAAERPPAAVPPDRFDGLER